MKCSTLGLVFALLLAPATIEPARADYYEAKERFESLSPDSRANITLGLIATGDFVGLSDFGFTKRFYGAITAFQSREGFHADGDLDPPELSRLNKRATNFYSSLGLDFYTHPFAGSKLLVPRLAFDSETHVKHGLAFQRKDRNLSLSFVGYLTSDKSFTELYETMSQPSGQRSIAYKRIRDGYFVSSGTYRGRNFYTWMSAVPGGSTGFTLSWSSSWNDVGSKLSILLANSFVATASESVSENPSTKSEQALDVPQDKTPESGSGTGFKITYEGHLLTNFHVAGRCKSILIRKTGQLPIPAELVAGDETNDLALVKVKQYLPGTVAKFRDGTLPKAGTDIAVFGFPLLGDLSESGNIVTGNITSLAGLGNDSRMFQISAPVQQGNSGGPVLDRHGSVIAVVVSKLNTIRQAALTGDVPQNVNFAIKGNVAMNFLDGTGVSYSKVDPQEILETTEIAELAQAFTFVVECKN